MKSIDTRSVTQSFTDSIVDLQKAKGYSTQDAYCFLAGYLGSHLASVIDQLPKAKRQAVLMDMTRTALSKMAEAETMEETA
jgi:hypothetical protein